MEPKILASYMGAFLVVVGTLLVGAQLWVAANEGKVDELSKRVNMDIHHIAAQTNVVGFGVLLVGAFLIIISILGPRSERDTKPKNSN
jgi:hypothetical protein